jgi:hypothetical protein
LKAGPATFSLRFCSDEAYATLTLPVGLGDDDVVEPGVPPAAGDDVLLHPAARESARKAAPSRATLRDVRGLMFQNDSQY